MQQVTITLIRFNPHYKINIQSRTLRSLGRVHHMRGETTPWSIHRSAQRLKKPKQEPKKNTKTANKHKSQLLLFHTGHSTVVILKGCRANKLYVL